MTQVYSDKPIEYSGKLCKWIVENYYDEELHCVKLNARLESGDEISGDWFFLNADIFENPETSKIILIYRWRDKFKLEATGTVEIAKQFIIRNLTSFNENLNYDSEILPPPTFIIDTEMINNEKYVVSSNGPLNINKLTLMLYGKDLLHELIQMKAIQIALSMVELGKYNKNLRTIETFLSKTNIKTIRLIIPLLGFATYPENYSIKNYFYLNVSTIPKDEISWNDQVIFLVLTVIFGFIHLIFEVRQFIYKPIPYIASPWNWNYDFSFCPFFASIIRPTSKYSYNQPSYTDNVNNPWNLVLTYHFILPNGIVSKSSLVETPNDNTNLFSLFSTSILSIYFMLTVDISSVSSWVLNNNWTLAILLVIFSFFTRIYLMNLFILLLGNAIDDKNNDESFLQLRGEIISKIELFWMLPHQRRKKNWFPEILYY
ncbi:hypothetical protein F8M41_013977 [Gigaspora margarita]|uniref:Ion transport domain-containing protein n=1 Tax=Gigaspora margarita TaxID=4874 RepID=A0A8H4ARY9_GIGMA|nr:hypothetical protein F8M41_013977 [Gigaspora margarita]